MNTIPVIAPNTIANITGIDGRPVYFVTLVGQAAPSLVVKLETMEMQRDEAVISIKWSSKLMKNVNDGQVNTKIMEPAEIAIFIAGARQFIHEQPKLLALAQNGVWVKMPYIAGITTADIWKKDAQQNYKVLPNELKKLMTHFTTESVWMELGKVIAVDCFNGNGDRFSAMGGDWVNEGNLMFKSQGYVAKVIGLDTFDTKAPDTANLARNVNPFQLDRIKTEVTRAAFAAQIITGIEERVKASIEKSGLGHIVVVSDGRMVSINSESSDFLQVYANNLVDGLNRGTNELKTYLLAKRQQYAQQVAAPPPNRPVAVPPRPQNFNAPPPNKPLPSKPLPVPPRPPVHAAAPAQAPAPARKTIPQGILDRMAYLNW